MEALKDKMLVDLKVVTTPDEASIEKEMLELVQSFTKASSFVENNLCVIQKTETRIEDMADVRHKLFLKALYSTARFKKDFAFASMVKGILVQNKLFFSISKDALIKAMAIDPDNTNKGASIHLAQFHAYLKEVGFCLLWDANEDNTSGLVVLNPTIRSLLKVDNEMALAQFYELKAFCQNDWIKEDMIFEKCGEKCGELRVTIEEHRLKIIEHRTKGSERGVMNIGPRAASVDVRDLFQKIVANKEEFHKTYSELDAPSFKTYLTDNYKDELLQYVKANDLKLTGFGKYIKQPLSEFLMGLSYNESNAQTIAGHFYWIAHSALTGR